MKAVHDQVYWLEHARQQSQDLPPVSRGFPAFHAIDKEQAGLEAKSSTKSKAQHETQEDQKGCRSGR